MMSDYSRIKQKWGMITIFYPYPRSEAHIACSLAEEAVGDGRLLRSEMICALTLVIQRMRLKAYMKHRIIPVHFPAPRVVINANAWAQIFVLFLLPECSGCPGVF